jgi:hypothetical protein
MANLEEALKELLNKHPKTPIASPTAIQRLKEKGLQIPESTKISLEKAVEDFFSEERKAAALEMAKKLPERLKIPVPAVVTLHNEIRTAAILGLNGAAITLSGILIEYMLKYATYKIEIGGFAKYDAKKTDEFEKLDFSNAINRADKNKLLTKKIKKELIEFKNDIRNPYNHYNIKKITSKIHNKNVTILDTNTGIIETKSIAAVDDPVIQSQAKPFADNVNVFPVIIFTDNIVKYLWNKISHLLKTAKSDSD